MTRATGMEYVLILGAKSDLGLELARIYARLGFGLQLLARGSEELVPVAAALSREFGIEARVAECDVLAFDSLAGIYQRLDPQPLGVVSTVGYLGRQPLAETEAAEARRIIDTNLTGPALFLELAAQGLSRRRAGFIVGVSSVAGERGRRRNYLYGAAKAGFSAYLSGLRGRLHPCRVQVLTVQLGYVRTKMTRGLRLPGWPLTLSAGRAAALIVAAQRRGADIVYVSALWWWVARVVRCLPEFICKRLDW